MNFTDTAWKIFNQSIEDYHVLDSVDTPVKNPFETETLERILYAKNWIDTVQWHLEDIIRDENIDPTDALQLKRTIDSSNQKRTDLVEYIDSWFLDKYKNITPKSDAKINTETPAWAVDRLSILALKVYHMSLEANRESASEEHRQNCQAKLDVLLTQKEDLSTSITQLLTDIENGDVKMKVYKQMKMYNDESLNPILYQKDQK
ncbi:DUF4254 domain-containing protein [Chryseobacterium indoltheticum]|jgi:hypothetical protein|uniref:DUF4254 domain-containing protein n=1 Tax=Chryseobacterium indoltheticum TaxID=254 RepID=A0A381F7L7_9FLAO|nr:DUF4254 domain-containing protein [Chryseobacterium indoltheticum]AZA72962.1 DUF4254 domain-containing protein [Chryseobacterium indoltheticum]SIP90232.1 Protein of unknown function [Chryseobacterium indoltheticum]SUX42570.1 Uncharacterised protein [Chryseobacterium indoltheticum]SUX46751.1 Uncharacterised protein [Chryseobacterium indoltheticum]